VNIGNSSSNLRAVLIVGLFGPDHPPFERKNQTTAAEILTWFEDDSTTALAKVGSSNDLCNLEGEFGGVFPWNTREDSLTAPRRLVAPAIGNLPIENSLLLPLMLPECRQIQATPGMNKIPDLATPGLSMRDLLLTLRG
jgi:hypothetical protein